MSGIQAEIGNLEAIVGSLSMSEKELFKRIFDIVVTKGRLYPPQGMRPWIEGQFGSVDRALEQNIVRVTNLVTFEEALFNPLRASRPVEEHAGDEVSAAEIDNRQTDIFSDPLANTPEDTFGRIEGRYCITASNIAKYEGFHGVIIFKEPDPLRFTREQVIDYIDTGWRWARKAHFIDPEARYYFFMWNCGGRAGASLPHGHAQVTLGKRRPYARVEQLRCAALSYRNQYGVDYFDDLYRAHHAVGCGIETGGIRVLAYLTPVKEKEVVLMAHELGESFSETLYEVLACFRDRMGVTFFNVALFMPPLTRAEEDWSDFPTIARVVDRGSAESKASDIGAMELYASSVISGDPFEVARVVKEALG